MCSCELTGVVARCVVLSCFLSAALAAVAMGPAYVDPRFPGQCFWNATAKAYRPGQSWDIEECTRVTCVTRGGEDNTLYVQMASCGTQSVPSHCYLESDLGLPYPECCPKPVCSDSIDKEVVSRDFGVDRELAKAREDMIRAVLYNWLLQEFKMSTFP